MVLRVWVFGVVYMLVASICIADEQITEKETRLEYARVLTYEKEYDKSVAEYLKLLTEDPQMVEARVELARVYYYQGNYVEALKQIGWLPPEAHTDDLEKIVGDIYLSQKDYVQAEKVYRKMLQTNPSNDAVKLRMAEMLSWQKKYGESLEFYRELLSRRPDDIQLRRKYALVLLWSGNDAEAAEELKKTLQ